MQPQRCACVCVYVPTVCMGFLYGSSPKLYWKTPLAWKRGMATPIILWRRSCMRRRAEPAGFSIWSKSSFSPNEKTGTSHALHTNTRVQWSNPGERLLHTHTHTLIPVFEGEFNEAFALQQLKRYGSWSRIQRFRSSAHCDYGRVTSTWTTQQVTRTGFLTRHQPCRGQRSKVRVKSHCEKTHLYNLDKLD